MEWLISRINLEAFNQKVYIWLFITPVVFIPVIWHFKTVVQKLDIGAPSKAALRITLNLVTALLVIRGVIGALASTGDHNLWAVGKFYPFRIAGVNFGLIGGWPYLLACIFIALKFEKIYRWIVASKWPTLSVWAFSLCLLLLFGGIQGGFLKGITGIASSPNHHQDIELADTNLDYFASHVDRTLGQVEPSYRASHSRTHPPFILLYWKLLLSASSPFFFSLCNAILFSFTFPIILWALQRQLPQEVAVGLTLTVLTVPGLLIYGVGSDDALYYLLWSVIMSLAMVGLSEGRFLYIFLATIALLLSVNFTYASIVVLPAMFSFNTRSKLTDLFRYLGSIGHYLLAAAGLLVVGLLVEKSLTGFSFVEGFMAVQTVQKPFTFLSLLARGEIVRAISDRIMVVCEPLLLAGPAFLYLLVRMVRSIRLDIKTWSLAGFSLAVLGIFIAINTPGAGETARGWGGLYILFLFACLPMLAESWHRDDFLKLLKLSLGWGLLLQAFITFIW